MLRLLIASTAARSSSPRGDLSWVVHGRIGERGIGYYADPHGGHLETATEYLSPG